MNERVDGSRALNRHTIGQLALSFDGYKHAGSFDACADIAENVRTKVANGVALTAIDTSDLRCALFFCQRSHRHAEDETAESMRWPRSLYAELRRRHGDAWVEEQSLRSRPPR